jgi:hydroxypyruvate isomerase
MPTWSAHISMLFAEHPYAERPARAHAEGFTHGESWWPGRAEDREALAGEAARPGLRVALVNTDGGDMAAGERGFLCHPALEDHARRAFLDGLALAERVGARSLHALVGCRPPDVPGRVAWDQAAGMLRELVPEATLRGVAVVVEALNPHDAPGYLTGTPEDVERLAADAGGGIGLLLDAYHVLCIGRDPAEEAARRAGVIGHVHVADAPGRGAPGTGELDLPAFLAALDDAGYDGPIGLEYDARGDTVGTLGVVRASLADHP